MNTISLLPPALKTQKDRSYIYRIFSTVIITLVILILITASIMTFSSFRIRKKIQVVRDENEILQTYIGANDQVLATHNSIAEYKKLIESGMGKAPNWNRFLIELAENRPNGITIHGIKGNYKDSITEISIKGEADNQKSLSAFLNRLKNLSKLEDIQCSFANQSVSDSNGSLSFETIVYLQEAEQYKWGVEQ